MVGELAEIFFLYFWLITFYQTSKLLHMLEHDIVFFDWSKCTVIFSSNLQNLYSTVFIYIHRIAFLTMYLFLRNCSWIRRRKDHRRQPATPPRTDLHHSPLPLRLHRRWDQRWCRRGQVHQQRRQEGEERESNVFREPD